MTPTLRVANLDDVPAMVGLLTQLFEQETEFLPQPQLQEEGLRRILTEPQTGRIYVAEYQGQVVGMVSLLLSISTALGKPVATLEDMIVTAAQRGKGIGSQLLDYAINQARLMGLKRLTLLTDRSNEPAQRLYQRCGFRTSEMIAMRTLL